MYVEMGREWTLKAGDVNLFRWENLVTRSYSGQIEMYIFGPYLNLGWKQLLCLLRLLTTIFCETSQRW